MVGQTESQGKSREGPFSRPVTVVVLLALVVGIAFWWSWSSEMSETTEEAGTAVDLQRVRLDLDVLSAVEALRQIEFLAGSSPSSDDFAETVRSAVEANRGIRSLRVLDRAGRQLLVARAEGRGGRGRSVSIEEGSGVVSTLDETFLEQLRGLPDDQVLVSEFAFVRGAGEPVPAVLVGAGLFYASGARAGFLVVDLFADKLLERMASGPGGGEGNLFIVSPEGKWIYDSRGKNPWEPLLREGGGRWIVDEYPDVWRAMISDGDGSHAAEDIWIFRDHVPLETAAGDGRRVLSPGEDDEGGVQAKPFFVLRRVDDGPTWGEIWTAVIPVIGLFALCVAILVPAILRKRDALAESERAARELREATVRTRMAMEAARISEWRIDLSNGVVETDKRINGMLLLGAGNRIRSVEDWENRIHPNDRRKVFDVLEPLWEKGMGTFSIRHRMRRGDDSWGWYRFRGAVRRENGEGDRFVLGAYIDLTDVVLREAELNRLEMATRQSLSGIAILDNEGVLEWANPAFRERSDRRGTSLAGRPVWDLFPFSGEEAEEDKAGIRDAIYRGQEFSLTVAFHPQGEESSWRRVIGNPVLDESGIPTHYVVVETDVSREKRAEADLRKSESLLTESQRLAGIGSWELDCEEDTLYWSDEIHRIFGVPGDFVPTIQTSLRFYEEEDREKLRRHLDEAIRSGRQFEGEFATVVGSGERRWVFVKGMALREGGVTSKVFGVVQDISSRKDYEEALVRAKEEAEHLNEKLAEALDKAHESERKAQEASEAKSAFLSMVSHEIRNPLNGVIGMTSLLRETNLDEAQEDYVETIHNSGSSLLMLLDDILDFSKIEHGKIEFEQKKFSVAGAVEESVSLFSTRIAQKGLDHAFWIDPEVPETVSGDVTRVKQILFNLIGNAVKFTDEGSVSVEVELRERLPNDRCLLVFRVKDTGIGIPADRHDRVFQSFSQVDPAISRKFGGTGLGLAISKELSQRMGGDIRFESDRGNGSVFEAVLPFPAQFGKKETGRKGRKSRGRALCCFRLETRAKHFEGCLEAAGFEVERFDGPSGWIEACRGAEADAWIFGDEDIAASDEAAPVFRERDEREGRRPPVLVAPPSSDVRLGFEAVRLTRPVSRKRIQSVLEGDDGKRTEKVRESSRAEPLQGAGGAMRILIAEDNAVNQKVIRLLLKRMGYECEVVENGRKALEKARSGGFDMILMDIQMPEMDGIEAAGRIVAEVPPEKRPWIVALTAGATRDNREEALGAGMDGYLTKPVQPNDLETELERAAEHARGRASLVE